MRAYKQKKPLEKKDFVRFQDLAKLINHYLKDEGITLTFKGYNETLRDYFRMDDNNTPVAFELMTHCNLWANYFGDIEGVIQSKALELQLNIDQLKAQEDKKNPEEERLTTITELTKKHKDLVLFLKYLKNQRKFFDKAHLHCYRVYAQIVNTLRFKSLN